MSEKSGKSKTLPRTTPRTRTPRRPPGGATSSPGKPKQSYRDLNPLEEGGRTARDGFDYQDHVAVNKCLDMLLGDGLSEVWCEAEDDIVLVWTVGAVEEFEFVQVKAHDLNQAWTVPKLCARELGKGGKKKDSIVEKSLAHDRGKEPCRFRVVTRWPPDTVLAVLVHPLSARVEASIHTLLSIAENKIAAALGVLTSPNGNPPAFWVKRAVWEHRSTTIDVRNDNLVKLNRVLDAAGEYLAPDQCGELHAALLAKVQDASLANGVTAKIEKRLVRDALRAWLLGRAKSIQHPTHSGGSGPLLSKLTEAALDGSSIEAAKELRRRYVAEARLPKYLAAEDREAMEGEVLAVLLALKNRLDAGEFNDDGRQFLSRCQTELMRLRDATTGPRPPESLVYGNMYEIMNRCLHRLARVRT
jgi:hypothetical protein